MRRRYRVERFLDRLDQIREMLGNDPAFSTDIIVGFPGGTEAEFEETLETCRKARFMKVHVFPFSRRDGTPAATMPDQVPPEVIKARVRLSGDLERELAEQFYLSRVRLYSGEPGGVSPLVQDISGRMAEPPLLEVLAERESETRPGYVRGSDRWYMPVVVPGTIDDLGKFVTCRAVSANREGVIAERISDLRIPMTNESQRTSGMLSVDDEIRIAEDEENCTGGLTPLRSPDEEHMSLIQLGTSNSGVQTWPR